MRLRDVICLRRCQHFPIDVAVICPLSVLAAAGHLSPQGEAGCWTETVLRPSDFRAARALRGSRKIVNGAYRYRYAPFLVPIYDALALPLGELSPQVTERALRPRDVICLRRCQHFPIDVAVICPSPSSLRWPPLPQGEARCWTETVLRPSDFRAARALRGSRKIVNGAYRYRYAPFLVPIYDALPPFGRAVTAGD